MDFINVEQLFPYAEDGASDSLDSALARPFNVLIKSGRNTGRINHIFFTDSEHFHIVGSLCFTPGKRLIFFPGIIGRRMLWDTDKGKLNEKGILDHITLEPDLQTWHLTIFDNGKKAGSHNLDSRAVSSIETGLAYWFGLSVSSPKVFEKQFQRHSFSFSVPDGKSDEYLKILDGAKKDSKFHSLSLVEEGLTEEEFLHFDFLIDMKKRSQGKEVPHNITSVPVGPPALREKMEKLDNFIIRAHPVELPTFAGNILILVSKHRGKLTQEVIIKSAPSSQ